MKKLPILLLAAGLFLSSCCKDDDDDKKVDPKPSTVELNFDSRFGNEDFSLQKVYINKNEDSIVISSLQYFVSNVELVKTDGSVHKVPDSYYLIQNTQKKVRESVTLPNIPAGEYSKLRFMVGVDSVRNQSLDNATGDLLTPGHMTWMWNTGFVFLDVAGQFYNPASSKYEVMGYVIGKDYNSRIVELNFPISKLDGSRSPKFDIHVDVKTLFGGPNVMDLKAEPTIDATPQQKTSSMKVADNYATMFKVAQVN